MNHYSRKEMFESALSPSRQNVAIRTATSPFLVLGTACRCCLHGNWKAATTNFKTAMNLIWTQIVQRKAGAHRKT